MAFIYKINAIAMPHYYNINTYQSKLNIYFLCFIVEFIYRYTIILFSPEFFPLGNGKHHRLIIYIRHKKKILQNKFCHLPVKYTIINVIKIYIIVPILLVYIYIYITFKIFLKYSVVNTYTQDSNFSQSIEIYKNIILKWSGKVLKLIC